MTLTILYLRDDAPIWSFSTDDPLDEAMEKGEGRMAENPQANRMTITGGGTILFDTRETPHA